MTKPAPGLIPSQSIIVSPYFDGHYSWHANGELQSIGSTASESSPESVKLHKTPRATIVISSDEEDDFPYVLPETLLVPVHEHLTSIC